MAKKIAPQAVSGHPARLGIPTLSLFSGAGGLDIGFTLAGFDIVASVEIEEAYARSLRANVGRDGGYAVHTVVHAEDVTTFDTTPYKGLGIKCVIGGPPCQTFSAAGRRSGGVIGLADDRGQLFLAYCRVLDELQPDYFVFENVYGLPGANGGQPWAEMCREFSSRGYSLRFEVLDAADYGVPQHRERLILVGSKIGRFEFPRPTHGPDSSSGLPLTSVLDAISDLQPPDEPFHDTIGGLYGHLLKDVPEGLNYSYFTAEMGHPEPVFAWRSKFHDLLYKVDRHSPCRTLKAQPGKFTGPFHWKNRHFTVAELKRLQTFPDSYRLEGSHAKILEQIGNSVPPRLAYVIALALKEQLIEPTKTLTLDKRPETFKSTFRRRQRERSKQFAQIAKVALAEKFGGRDKLPQHAPKNSSYFLVPASIFDRTRSLVLTGPVSKTAYSVKIEEIGRTINLEMASSHASDATKPSTIQISGLGKYLPQYDHLRMSAKISTLTDVFHVWAAIEGALVERSQFYSLIDIYGHYANRGDVVDIHANWSLRESAEISAVLEHFSSTENCGDFVPLSELGDIVRSPSLVDQVVLKLRNSRFDIRTYKTHPIIGKTRVLCTYPFPLLSPRALVESRALLSRDTDRDLMEAAE